jgi:hypothetical protein
MVKLSYSSPKDQRLQVGKGGCESAPYCYSGTHIDRDSDSKNTWIPKLPWDSESN